MEGVGGDTWEGEGVWRRFEREESGKGKRRGTGRKWEGDGKRE